MVAIAFEVGSFVIYGGEQSRVAYLAGLQAGMFGSLADIQDQWQRQAVFAPSKTEQETQALYDGWQKAIRQVLVY